MKKILDYYYVVLISGLSLSYRVTGLMALSLTLNVASFVILFYHYILDYYAFWISFVVVTIVLSSIFDAMYKKKRREELLAKYDDESQESRRQKAAWVWFYEIASIVFLIWALSMIEIPK